MNVSDISNSSDYQQVYAGRSKARTSAPVSFGYGEDSYTSSVAASYIQKQQQEKAQQALKQKKEDQWIQFGLDVLKGITIGAALIGGTALVATCTKVGREMAQSLTHNNSLPSNAKCGASTFKTAATAGENIDVAKCKKMLQEVNLNDVQQKYVFDNICMANKSIKKAHYRDGVDINTCGNRGAILYGRGGIGKSYAMEQIAKACGASYTSIKGSDFMNMYQGASEENLKNIFIEAKAKAEETPDKPVIIFMDEGESILGSGRTHGSNNTNAMLRSILLGALETEGTDALPPNVKIIVTTNYVDDIDEPFRRDGRLGTPMELLCPTPEKQKEIMETQFKKILPNETYQQYKEIINSYLKNRYECITQHLNVLYEASKKDSSELWLAKQRLAELQETQKKLEANYYSTTIKGSSEETNQAGSSKLDKCNQDIQECMKAIDFYTKKIQMEDNKDGRNFNFTPAEIKGLVTLFVESLLVKDGDEFTKDNMIKLEKQKIKELRENQEKMMLEHQKKMQKM